MSQLQADRVRLLAVFAVDYGDDWRGVMSLGLDAVQFVGVFSSLSCRAAWPVHCSAARPMARRW